MEEECLYTPQHVRNHNSCFESQNTRGVLKGDGPRLGGVPAGPCSLPGPPEPDDLVGLPHQAICQGLPTGMARHHIKKTHISNSNTSFLGENFGEMNSSYVNTQEEIPKQTEPNHANINLAHHK